MTSEILQKECPGDSLGDPFFHRSKEVKKRKSWSQASGYVNDLKLKVLFLKKKKKAVPCSGASAKNGCKIGIVHLPLRALILSASSYLGQPQVSSNSSMREDKVSVRQTQSSMNKLNKESFGCKLLFPGLWSSLHAIKPRKAAVFSST